MKRFCGSSPSVEDCLNCPYEECINDYVRKQYKPNGDIVVRRRQQQAEFRNKRRENGFCPYCGKRKMPEGYRMCEVCRAYFRAKKNESAHKNGVLPRSLLDGIERCSKCGRRFDGKHEHKLCSKCYEQAIEALDKTPSHTGGQADSYFRRWHETFWTNTLSQKSV